MEWMNVTATWLFDGLGTMIAGLLIGGTGGSIITRKVITKNSTNKQRSGNNSVQIQAGRDIKNTQ